MSKPKNKNKDFSQFIIFIYCICFYALRCTLTSYQTQLTCRLLEILTKSELQGKIFDTLYECSIAEVYTDFSYASLALLVTGLQRYKLQIISMHVVFSRTTTDCIQTANDLLKAPLPTTIGGLIISEKLLNEQCM